jgi:arylformamidase
MLHHKKIIDISWSIRPDMTTYKDRRDVSVTAVASWEPHQYRLSALAMNAHTGTHIDAPSHFLEDGITVDKMSLADLMGACHVIDLSHCEEKISASDLENIVIQPDSILVIKTKNSALLENALFDYNFIYLAADAVELLASKKIKAIGFDYIGIERAQGAHESHKVFMQKNIAIIEGLRLAHVAPGAYTLICLPIKLHGVDGAPARVILLHD